MFQSSATTWRGRGAVLGAEAFLLRFFGERGDDRLLLINLGIDVQPSPTLERVARSLPPVANGRFSGRARIRSMEGRARRHWTAKKIGESPVTRRWC